MILTGFAYAPESCAHNNILKNFHAYAIVKSFEHVNIYTIRRKYHVENADFEHIIMPMIVGILGLGEVGTALLQCYNDKEVEVHTKDIDGDNFPRLDVLNVCIPYTETFVQTVTKQIIKSRPGLIIIHSTVPPGTTSQIDAASVCCVVHSPVRGSHPDLSKSLMTFTKYIGANTQISATKAEKHYDFLGIPHKTVKNAATTETAKLLCTSYYGVCIAWHDYVADVCESVGVDTNFISEWNNTYNLGYQALDLSKYTRPLLQPPENKKIGGHCIIPNAELLNNVAANDLLDALLKYR